MSTSSTPTLASRATRTARLALTGMRPSSTRRIVYGSALPPACRLQVRGPQGERESPKRAAQLLREARLLRDAGASPDRSVTHG